MVKPLRTGKFEMATGYDWPHWIKFLDAASARARSHRQIVAKVATVPDVSDWCAQYVAIAYEQHIGRRLPGQKSDGTFCVTLSRKIAANTTMTFSQWIELIDGEKKIAGRKLQDLPRTSDTRSGLNWRCKLEDGSKVTINFLACSPGKTQISVQHERLSEPEAVDGAKAYWSDMAEKLLACLAAPPAIHDADSQRTQQR